MIDPDVAMRHALISVFKELGYPSDEMDAEEFINSLRSFGYVIVRLDRRTGDDPEAA
jgi:hypothetical protein